MKVLIIGSGGREHAILKEVLKSSVVKKVYVAPGNSGMAEEAECVAIPPKNMEMLTEFAIKNKVDLTIVGPELPLTLGIVDEFESKGLKVFGPSKEASILEGSKIFTKEFCARHKIPTADFQSFDNINDAKNFLKEKKVYPIVIKADGLAAGKGVIICKSYEDAEKALTDMMLYEKFGNSGRKVLIEDFLQGEEASFIVLASGEDFLIFPSSQDHKRIYEGDKGPNTGGMGAYAPAPVVTDSVKEKIIERVIKPTLKGMASEGRTYKGFLYAGLMIDKSGDPFLIEYNCRLGDPEAEVLLPQLKTDLLDLLNAAISEQLSEQKIEFHKGACACVVLASKGYPGDYEKGKLIKGIDEVSDDVFIFHAGTKKRGQEFLTQGGRVLVVSARGQNLQKALDKVYDNIKKIDWDGMYYRKDIGKKGLLKNKQNNEK